MSVKIMARVWTHSQCTGTELLTVLALADWADDDGWCWPSLPKLAKKTRVTVSQLCKTLTAIEQRTGEIYRERSTGGRNRRTRYRVTITENSITDNSVVYNSVVENSVVRAPKTVSPTRGALIRHRSVNNSSEPNGSVTPSHSKKRKHVAPDPAALEAFTKFYQAYPRHVKKKSALKAWLKLNPDAALTEAIMKAVTAYSEQVQDSEPRFIMHPSTWLNEEAWEDEPVSRNGNGHAKPAEVKELANGMVEVDGRPMDRRIYERRYGQHAN